jgi:site-specific recombinase XerD
MGKRQPYIIDRSKFMSEEQCKHLLKTCDEHMQLDLLLGRRVWVTRSMFVSIALRTGLRVGEIVALKCGDIHISNKESYLVVTKGKGNRRRDVYFNGTLTKELKRYIEIKRKSWGQPTGRDDLLFCHGRDHKRYTTTGMFCSFREALRKANLPVSQWEGPKGAKIAPWEGGKRVEGFHPHSCRHSFATHSLAATNDLRHVQKQLGHSSISMTALYSDVEPKRRAELAEKLAI